MTDGLVLDIELQGLADVAADVEGYPQSVSHELTVAMESSLSFLKGQVTVRTPVNTGKLRASITHSITSQFPNLIGVVGSPLPYAPVMEEGRRPGAKMPPVGAIQHWVIRKLGIRGKEGRAIAWLIARSIAKKGIEGKHMFQEGFEASEPTINQLFNEAIARSVARFNQS